MKALLLALAIALQASATDSLTDTLNQLKDASPREAETLEEQAWTLFLESGSPTVDILMERGVAAVEGGDLDLARDMFDRAIRIRPDYAEAWNRRATVFFLQNDAVDAVRDLEEALRLEPRHFGAWAALGLIFERIGAEAEALDAYRRALELHPNLAAAKTGAGRLQPKIDGRGL